MSLRATTMKEHLFKDLQGRRSMSAVPEGSEYDPGCSQHTLPISEELWNARSLDGFKVQSVDAMRMSTIKGTSENKKMKTSKIYYEMQMATSTYNTCSDKVMKKYAELSGTTSRASLAWFSFSDVLAVS